jgi:hypothetical protein
LAMRTPSASIPAPSPTISRAGPSANG